MDNPFVEKHIDEIHEIMLDNVYDIYDNIPTISYGPDDE